MLKVVVAPILLFALGFVPGLIMSAAASSWRIRAVTCVVLWSPVLVLLFSERFEAVEPGTLSLVSAVLPRAVKLPLMGILVGYGLHTLLTVRQTGREAGP